MHKVAIIILGCLTVVFFILGLNNYSKANRLEKENQQLQERIKNLTSQNQYYQEQINTQLQEQTTKENVSDAESQAVQFVRIYHNTSLNPQVRLQQLKRLMVPAAYTKKFGNSQQQKEDVGNSNVQSRIELKNIRPFRDGEVQKFNIDYDYIGNVDNTESYVEKMNIIVHMVVNNGKWLVNDFELTYVQGPDHHAD